MLLLLPSPLSTCNATPSAVHGVDRPTPSAGLLPWYIAKDLQHPLHIAWVWDNVSGKGAAYPHYVGGVLSLSQEQMRRCNGFPNNYWGWGGEDDEMMRRCKSKWGKEFRMAAPKAGSITDLEDMALDEKLAFLKGHKDWKVS